MNIALTVLEIVAPVFLLAALGFTWVKLGFEYRIQFVTQLAMSIGVPCLIFVSLMQAEITPEALSALSFASIATYAAITVGMWLFVWIARLDRRTYLAPMTFGNTGNLGLPLAFFAFGQSGLNFAIVVFALMAIWSFTYGIWLVAGQGAFQKVFREPLVWATVLGGLFLWQGWETPTFVTNTLSLVGQIGIPLMLITLGVAVARLTPHGFGLALVLSLFKVVACAGVAWVIGAQFDLEPAAFGVLVLQAATPVAVTSYLLAEKYGADSENVAGLVVVSTLVSVGALPLILSTLL
ncbi:MAG: AEC family transporter [Pseudomonadota bacterium]